MQVSESLKNEPEDEKISQSHEDIFLCQSLHQGTAGHNTLLRIWLCVLPVYENLLGMTDRGSFCLALLMGKMSFSSTAIAQNN